MLHSEHVRRSTNTNSLLRAHQLVDQLRLIAKIHDIDYQGIKIVDKRNIVVNNIGSADAIVSWDDGPAEWAYVIGIIDTLGVCHDILDGKTVAFYDI